MELEQYRYVLERPTLRAISKSSILGTHPWHSAVSNVDQHDREELVLLRLPEWEPSTGVVLNVLVERPVVAKLDRADVASALLHANKVANVDVGAFDVLGKHCQITYRVLCRTCGLYLLALLDRGTDINVQILAQLLVSCEAAVVRDVGVGKVCGDVVHRGGVLGFFRHGDQICGGEVLMALLVCDCKFERMERLQVRWVEKALMSLESDLTDLIKLEMNGRRFTFDREKVNALQTKRQTQVVQTLSPTDWFANRILVLQTP
jgi:hypothetical protein